MVLIQKMTHLPISCEKSYGSSCWQAGTFTIIVPLLRSEGQQLNVPRLEI